MQRIARLPYLLLCLSFLLITSTAQAKKSTKPADIYNGFFMSIAAGPGMISSDMELATSLDYIDQVVPGTPVLHTLTYAHTMDNEELGVLGRASVGYGGCIGNCWYLGVELSVFGMGGNEVTEEVEVEEESTDPGTGDTATLAWKSEITPAIGVEGALDFKTGFFLSEEFFVYGRVGAAVADIEITSVLEVTPSSTLLVGQADQEITDSHVGWGLNVGVGVEQKIVPQLGLVFEYSYVNYGSFTVDHEVVTYSNTGVVGATTGVMTSDADVTVSQQALWIGFNYHF